MNISKELAIEILETAKKDGKKLYSQMAALIFYTEVMLHI